MTIPDENVLLRFKVPREIFRQKRRGPLVLGARVGVDLFEFLSLFGRRLTIVVIT